jgi:hypothetical protein
MINVTDGQYLDIRKRTFGMVQGDFQMKFTSDTKVKIYSYI